MNFRVSWNWKSSPGFHREGSLTPNSMKWLVEKCQTTSQGDFPNQTRHQNETKKNISGSKLTPLFLLKKQRFHDSQSSLHRLYQQHSSSVWRGKFYSFTNNIDWSFFLLGREKKKKDLERKAMKVIVRRNFPRIKKFYKNQEAIEAGSFLRINLPLKSSKHPRVKV